MVLACIRSSSEHEYIAVVLSLSDCPGESQMRTVCRTDKMTLEDTPLSLTGFLDGRGRPTVCTTFDECQTYHSSGGNKSWVPGLLTTPKGLETSSSFSIEAAVLLADGRTWMIPLFGRKSAFFDPGSNSLTEGPDVPFEVPLFLSCMVEYEPMKVVLLGRLEAKAFVFDVREGRFEELPLTTASNGTPVASEHKFQMQINGCGPVVTRRTTQVVLMHSWIDFSSSPSREGNDVYLLDPRSGQVRPGPPFPKPLRGLCPGLDGLVNIPFGDNLLVLGATSREGDEFFYTLYEYAWREESWRPRGNIIDMPWEARGIAAAFYVPDDFECF